ncbi:aspartyl-tRNA(Asn)/glutamyl-tRNA(Gln) amidotransferase subunit A [Amycolatopsis sacchari]|uniref:Aspartyl-tRNA(Asn)/glutamyl-tRNA(Gln) amidotransferase subunit A n=1 Tax=Amycolatopsis sacchari TaxID=115433 RepID=A0A1I4AJ97_9PSEU|nr:amidase [Amycolatopsis sacchari]SFK55796.1 aspartyl-tRNA(Asn)/glutamyl-tRNA(Gln) amidotransferase subunit A [Amycolatopsis sacchari]
MGPVRERVERYLARTRERDRDLRAFIAVLADRARWQADERDATPPARRGSLHGLTVSLKDNIDVAGVRSTAGSAHHGGVPAARDATVTRLLDDAGAVVLGKNNMAEFAMGATGRNAVFGDCRNARDGHRIAGGSSSGSGVAVAAELVEAALGTDTGGSGRIPASVNGVVGLRPTVGRVSNRGVFPVSPSFDTVTPIAGDVRTVARVLAALDRFDPDDPTAVPGERTPVDALLGAGLDGLRVGVAGGFLADGVEPGVRRVVATATELMARHGATATPVTVAGAESAQERMLEIMYPEAAGVHAERMRADPRSIDADVLRRLRIGAGTPEDITQRARRWRRDFQARASEVFSRVDVVVCPTIPVDVPRADAVDLAASTRDLARFTYVWAMYGGPSMSVPCGRHPESGMPVGLHLAAAPWREDVLLRAAAGFEAALGGPVSG